MLSISVACPSLNTYSSLLDVRSIDPANILVKLSKELGVNDAVTVYGTFDSTATSSSVNLTQINTLAGNNGNAVAGLSVFGWPFLLAVRTSGASVGGTIIASGNQNSVGGVLAPPSATLPGVNAYSSLVDLSAFGGGAFRIGLSANQTANDSFLLLGTNDSTAGTAHGATSGQLLATLTGGGSVDFGTLIVSVPFRYFFLQRISGSTSGNFFVWSTVASTPSNSTGTLVNITSANSPFTAPQGADVNVDSSGGPVTVIVPSALGVKTVVKYKGPTSNPITLQMDNGLIDGQANLVLSVGWDCSTIVGQGPSVGGYVTG